MTGKQYIVALIFAVWALPHTISAQKYFKVLDATSVSWSGGMRQSGTGTTYYIKAVLLTNQKVTFSDIWIGKEYGVPRAASATYTDGRSLSKGDTVLISYSSIHHYEPSPNAQEPPKPVYKSPPYPIRGEALLGFTAGKGTKYRSIEKFRSLPPLNYP